MSLSLRVRLPLARFDLDVAIASTSRSLAVFGASGSGKTSLLECLTGWRRPADGRIEALGTVLFDATQRIDLPPERRALGYVPQDVLLFPHLSTRQNILFGAAPGGSELVERALDVLELRPLLNRPVTTLSGGERARVSLARALASRPRLLVLDEPFGSLDWELRRRVLPHLVRTSEAFDVPLVFVSHDPTEVQALCAEVVVLERGRVVAQGPPARVLADRASHEVGFENVLRGIARTEGGRTRVEIAPGVDLRVAGSGAVAGEPALVALRAEDVIVAVGELPRTSARNVLPARVAALRVDGEDAWLDADAGGARIVVSLTRSSVEELGLAPGTAVRLVAKAQACRVLAGG